MYETTASVERELQERTGAVFHAATTWDREIETPGFGKIHILGCCQGTIKVSYQNDP